MKKDRNSFFSQYSMNASMFSPYGGNPNVILPEYNIEERLAKLEREIQKLNQRVATLESTGNKISNNITYDNTMYMI